MDKMRIRDTVAEISLGCITHNLRGIKHFVGEQVSVAAVVKADAYGHGAVGIAPALMGNGADMLAVAMLSEALELKQAYPHYRVLVMGLTPEYAMELVVEYDIIQTVDSLRQARQLNEIAGKKKKKAKVHIKLDTGFHRLGFGCGEESIHQIVQICRLENLEAEGLYTHLALTDERSNEAQDLKMQVVIGQLQNLGCSFLYTHMADSISAVDYPEYHRNMVRIGAILYGLKGFHTGTLPLKQALTLKTRISHITDIKEGEGVSYDYLWKAPKATRVGTLPFGYADGYPRNMCGKGTVSICGRRASIVGVICMDQCIVDLTGIPEAQVGTEAIIYGDGSGGSMTIEEASQMAGTNKNEIVSRISPRVPRVYI